MPESVRFLAGKGRHQEAIAQMRKVEKLARLEPQDWRPEHFSVVQQQTRAHLKDLFTPTLAGMTILVALLYFTNLVVTYGLSSWLPSLLVQHGFSLVKSYSYGAVQAVAASIGAFALGYFLDKHGRKPTLIVSYTLAALSVAYFGYAKSDTLMLIAGFLTGFFVIGSQNSIQTLVGETFPTQVRSTGAGFVYGFGRIGAFVAPLLGGVLVMFHVSFTGYFVVFAIPCLICVGLVLLYRIKSTRTTLEQITADMIGNK
jgi:MFS family permease